MQFDEPKNMGTCVICGKKVPVRDIRADKYTYCGRAHAALGRFKTRYKGSLSGPLDRPTDILGKTKWEK